MSNKQLPNIKNGRYRIWILSIFFWGCAPPLPPMDSVQFQLPDSFLINPISDTIHVSETTQFNDLNRFLDSQPVFSSTTRLENSSPLEKAKSYSAFNIFFKDSLLVNILDSIIERNLDLAISSQKIEGSFSEVILTKGWLRPRVDLNLGSALRRYGLYTMDGAGNSSTYMLPGKIVPTNLPDYLVGFQSNWEIDVWGKLNDRKKSALHKYLSSQEAKNWLITQLIKKASHHYYELQACDLELKCIEESILLQSRAYEIVKAKKEAAKLNELAVRQFEAQLLELMALKKEVENRIVVNEKELNDLLGRFYQPIVRDSSFYNQIYLDQVSQRRPLELLSNRSDIQQAYWIYQSTINDVFASRKSFYPSLMITSSLGFQGFRPDLLFLTPQSLAYTLVGNSLMPIFNRTFLRAQYLSSTANYLEANLNYIKTVVLAYNETQSEWEKMNNYSQIFILKQEETKRLSESVNIAEELFRNGRATYLEVLFAQQNTLKSKIEMIDARKYQLITLINLYAAYGGGWRN